jgi:hypothetical protein
LTKIKLARSDGKNDRRDLAFEHLQEVDKIPNLARVEAEFRHAGVTDDDSLPQRFLKSFNRIAQMQRSERRCDFYGAWADFVDGMTFRTMNACEHHASLHGRRCLSDGDAGRRIAKYNGNNCLRAASMQHQNKQNNYPARSIDLNQKPYC